MAHSRSLAATPSVLLSYPCFFFFFFFIFFVAVGTRSPNSMRVTLRHLCFFYLLFFPRCVVALFFPMRSSSEGECSLWAVVGVRIWFLGRRIVCFCERLKGGRICRWEKGEEKLVGWSDAGILVLLNPWGFKGFCNRRKVRVWCSVVELGSLLCWKILAPICLTGK